MTDRHETETGVVKAEQRDVPRATTIAAVCVVVALAILFLRFGAALFVPLAEAIIVWFVVNSMARAIQRLPGIGPAISPAVALALAIIVICLLGIFAVIGGIRGAINLGAQTAEIEQIIEGLFDQLELNIGVDWAAWFEFVTVSIGIVPLFQRVVLGFVSILNQVGLVGLFVAFLFADQFLFSEKLRLLFPDPKRRENAKAILSSLIFQVESYLWLMSKVSFWVASLSFLILAFFDVPNPLFWSILIFILNFIPNIGSILGATIPALFSVIHFQNIADPIALGLALGAVQMTMGNVVLPRMAGTQLNLSYTVTIFCLLFWGTVWGITGMFLAVPLTAILVIVLASFDETRFFARFLSKTGQVRGLAPTQQP